MATQQRMFDPFQGDPYAERARKASRLDLDDAKQLVIELLVSAGGSMGDEAILEAAELRGLATDDLSAAVTALEREDRLDVSPGRLRLVA